MKYYLSQYVRIIENKEYIALYNFLNGRMSILFSDTELKLTYDGRDKGQSVRLVCPAN